MQSICFYLQVEILFEETFFNANKESFSILCIERPLEGGNGNDVLSY